MSWLRRFNKERVIADKQRTNPQAGDGCKGRIEAKFVAHVQGHKLQPNCPAARCRQAGGGRFGNFAFLLPFRKSFGGMKSSYAYHR